MLPASFTRTAFITLQPVRRAASRQNAGPSSPCSWRMLREQRSASSATSSSVAFTNTPTISSARRSSAPISSPTAGSQRRGLPSQKISPIPHAPSSAATRASSRLVVPQLLTRVMTPPMVAARALREGERLVALLAARVHRRGPVPERDLGALQLVAAVELDGHLVAGFLRGEHGGDVVRLGDRLAGHLHDQVAARVQAAAQLGLTRPQAGLVRRAAGGDLLDERTLAGWEVEALGVVLRHG